MTVQAGVEVDVDLATLVGEMEALPCESAGHGESHYGGSATHYIKWTEPCGQSVKAYCYTVVQMVQANLPFHCHDCGYVAPAGKCGQVLGPVNK